MKYLRRALGLLGAATLGCGRPDASASPGVVSVLRIPASVHRKLVENSVAVTSVSQPGIIFGLNDSGNDPLLFAYDSTGRGRGVWSISGAINRDWEAAAIGPCDGTGAKSCLFIGDVGDNDARRRGVTVYRVAEPAVPGSKPDSQYSIRVSDRLDIRYPDHPHNVEAMYVTSDGSVFLITKERLLDGQRHPRPALIFRIPASAWDSSGIVTASLADSLLPIVPGESQGRLVSDAALSPDGKLLAVRTYAEVFVFAIDSATGLPVGHIAPAMCGIRWLREKQGEGVGWWWDRRRLVLTSEGRNAPFFVVQCPLPKM
jgi:hypothetical protein